MTMMVRRLALAAVAGPLVFTAAWVVLGFMSTGYVLFGTLISPYSAITQPVSGLGLGATGPFMNAAFVVSGLLIVIGVAAAFHSIADMSARARWTCSGLLAISGVGAVVDGIFTLESMLLHSLGFLLAVTPIATFLVVGFQLRRVSGWRRFGTWLTLGSPLTLVLTALFLATFKPDAAGAGVGISGLLQRVLIVEIHAWYATLGWLAFRDPRPRAGVTTPALEPAHAGG
jgi:hypothetical protein